MGTLESWRTASSGAIAAALESGGIFNVANILLVVAIDAAGMAVAFPVGVELALVIGTVASYYESPKGNAVLLSAGVLLVVLAMIISAVASSRMRRQQQNQTGRGVAYAIAAGCLMGFFYPHLMRSISPDFNSAPIQVGRLTPYTALLVFGIGLLVSNVVVNTWFMRSQKSTFAQYARAKPRLHLLGIFGGMIWMTALTTNVVAS